MVKPFLRSCGLWLPVILCMAVIFRASSLPGKDIPSLFAYQDILFHAAIYAILSLFFYRAAGGSRPGVSRFKLFFYTVIFCSLYGASDEFHQLYTPGRDCSVFDWMVDTVGSCAGAFVGGGLFNKWLK